MKCIEIKVGEREKEAIIRYHHEGVIASDYLAVVKHVLNGQWEDEWSTIMSNKMREIKDTVCL